MGLLTLFLVLSLAIVPGAAQAKKKKVPRTIDRSLLGGPVTEPAPGGALTLTEFTTEVGKKYKRRRIRDVNVTIQLFGGPPPDPLGPLMAILRAPNGRNVILFFGGLAGTTAGPVAFDDEADAEELVPSPPAFTAPVFLYEPYVGSVQPAGGTLSVMDDGPVRGIWRLQLYDFAPDSAVQLLSWRLEVRTGKRYATRRTG